MSSAASEKSDTSEECPVFIEPMSGQALISVHGVQVKDGSFADGTRPESESPGSVSPDEGCRGTQWGLYVLTEKFPKDGCLYFVVSVFRARNQKTLV